MALNSKTYYAFEYTEVEPTFEARFVRFVARAGKIGFVFRGIIYFVIGVIALAGISTARKTEGVVGAIELLATSTFGTTMLIILTIGLFAYAIWRLFEGLAGLQIRSEAKLITKIVFRFPPVISALIYMFYGVAVILTLSDPQDENSTSWSAQFAATEFGRVVLGIAGVVFIILSGYQIYYGGTNRFKQDLNYSRMSRSTRRFIFTIGRIGIIGRGIVFLLFAVLLFRVIASDSTEELGIGGALGQLQSYTWGQVILVLVCVPLCIFGIFSVFQAKWKKFKRTTEELLLP
eukprot:TRINITY_DN2910_c0_g1_i1.p1 TRINITY_DN2910_c0_g1~~TRINITY_DN2910_c0_g1_i1.p1  ORF type:complete len:290 (+),score=16.63 TRINITY_DN2910_c0_g1_i1:80-949(+)